MPPDLHSHSLPTEEDEVFHPNKINPELTQLDIGLIHLVDARALSTVCHIQPRVC